MTIRFLSVAEAELAEAVDYYEAQAPGLGAAFATEVRRTLARIAEHPAAWQPLSERTRRCRTRRFPYGVVYQAQPEQIVIVAVMHLHRSPTHWRERSEGKA